MVRGPDTKPVNGGISQMASAVNIVSGCRCGVLERGDVPGQEAGGPPANRARPITSSTLRPTLSSWARARCNRLLTAAVLAPTASATSAAFHCSIAQHQDRG